MSGQILPRYPIYIPSKGRPDICLTANFLIEDGVPFYLVIEEQEYDDYASRYGKDRILVLPFSNRGSVVPARNWIKEHATAAGHYRHWQLDDNITRIERWYKSHRLRCPSGVALSAVEDFTDRYTNIAVSGMHYHMFAFVKLPPFLLNSRVYSCNLTLNELPNEWRGVYNEDTDFCLQVLADGWCTVLVNVFLIHKITTMIMPGGNTDELNYHHDGRLKMARSLERRWPGVVGVNRRYSRPQHIVKNEWRSFDTKLILKPDIDLKKIKPNEYGLELKQVKPGIRNKDLKALVRNKKKDKTENFEPALGYKLVKGGNVPGGHNVFWDGKRKPFITPMKECNSIPLRHSDVVVDIGAYVGTYAIRCARFPVKKVIAYEPTPMTFDLLSMTALPNLETVQAAIVGNDQKEIDLHISRGIGVTNSTVLSNQKVDAITVPAINYKDAVANASIVKIDVEGAEYDFPIIQPQLRAIIIDFHPVPGDWIGRAESIVQDLKDAGFKTIIQPAWENGWTRAGSWVRPMETSGEFTPLMQGDLCSGCGVSIQAESKALCPPCFRLWSKKHRAEFEYGTLV